MADEYPNAHVIGTDLSPIQPTFVPPNCHFEIEDCNLDWTYPASHFDFVHVRELFGSVPDWDRFFAQALHTLKPGGYMEVIEHSVTPISDDGTVGPESFYALWGNTVTEMGERRGKSFDIWRESRGRMEKAGFVECVESTFRWPMNGWSKDPKLRELGRWNQLRLYDGIEGMMIRMLTNAGGVGCIFWLLSEEIIRLGGLAGG
jgi:SAM-dependent methyltransferase